MNTTLSPGTRPLDTEDLQVLQIPAPEQLRELALADRLSLRLGLWLLRRAQRTPHRIPAPVDALLLDEHALTPRDAMALHGFDVHRQLR